NGHVTAVPAIATSIEHVQRVKAIARRWCRITGANEKIPFATIGAPRADIDSNPREEIEFDRIGNGTGDLRQLQIVRGAFPRAHVRRKSHSSGINGLYIDHDLSTRRYFGREPDIVRYRTAAT